MLSTKFRVSWPFGSGEKRKIDCQDSGHCGHLGFQIGMSLAIHYLQVTLIVPTKFRVFGPFGSGQEATIDFQNGGHSGHGGHF